MGRDGRDVWAKRVSRWRDSGLTAREFAAEIGVNANTLSHWGWQLDGGKRRRAKRAEEGKASAAAGSAIDRGERAGDGAGHGERAANGAARERTARGRVLRTSAAASTPAVAWLEVVADDAGRRVRATPPISPAFELLLGTERTIRVPVGFDAEALRRLIAVVEAD